MKRICQIVLHWEVQAFRDSKMVQEYFSRETNDHDDSHEVWFYKQKVNSWILGRGGGIFSNIFSWFVTFVVEF